MRGALTRIGDSVDRLTGRRWVASSSLATSELIERIKKLLDTEAKQVAGKGTVAPHIIKIKMQWDKFSTDAEDALANLEHELLAAAADHINDSLYYTYAPLEIKITPDYFTEGVKLFVSFDTFSEDGQDAEMNVTIPGISLTTAVRKIDAIRAGEIFITRFEIGGTKYEKRLEFPAAGRLSVGRAGGNGLVIDDPSVSKIHASLVANADGRLSVADTGSTNGTFINGERISYGKAERLAAGDRVKFGSVVVVFESRPTETESDEETIATDGLEFISRRAEAEHLAANDPLLPTAEDTLQIDPTKSEIIERDKPELDGENKIGLETGPKVSE